MDGVTGGGLEDEILVALPHHADEVALQAGREGDLNINRDMVRV